MSDIEKYLGNWKVLQEGMRLIVEAIGLVGEDVSDEVISGALEIPVQYVGEVRKFLVQIGFVSKSPRVRVGYDGMVDVGEETKEVYTALKALLLANLHGDDGDRYKILDMVQRYQGFMLKAQERYHNVKIFRKFQELVLEEVGRFDEGARLEILGKMKDLISKKF